MKTFNPLRTLPNPAEFGENDVLVVFGEVFTRGYVNGLIDEAVNAGCRVVYSTVGRRENQNLRPLTEAELSEKGHGPIINVPLEAGFDLEPSKDGTTPTEQLKEYGLKGWEDARLNWDQIEESRTKAIQSFRSRTTEFLTKLEPHLKNARNIIFAHTMAGGFPRAKVVMPIANRVFKGYGPRYMSSQMFWDSEIGKLCDLSFKEVTGETLRHLIDLSAPIRDRVTKNGGRVRYAAYGYHGNEVLVGNQYTWYSYSPYLQGFAKVHLEDVADEATAKDVTTTVFNVPEILTNSSSIFLGVEVVLYPLLRALQKEAGGHPRLREILDHCKSLLKPEFSLTDIEKVTQEYLTNPKVMRWPSFKGWPQHNNPEQMELMLLASEKLIDMHRDPKNLMTGYLSELVFRATGKIMFHELWEPRDSTLWIGHDLCAKATFTN